MNINLHFNWLHLNEYGCKQYIRNTRDRTTEKINVDNKTAFYIDLLDTIHCNFVHSFDLGYRINTSQISLEQKQNDEDDEDYEVNYLHQLLALKHRTLKNITKRLLMRNHRFTTLLSGFFMIYIYIYIIHFYIKQQNNHNKQNKH